MMLLCILLADGAAAQGGQAGAEEREDGLEDEQLRVRHGFDAEDGEGDADDAGERYYVCRELYTDDSLF